MAYLYIEYSTGWWYFSAILNPVLWLTLYSPIENNCPFEHSLSELDCFLIVFFLFYSHDYISKTKIRSVWFVYLAVFDLQSSCDYSFFSLVLCSFSPFSELFWFFFFFFFFVFFFLFFLKKKTPQPFFHCHFSTNSLSGIVEAPLTFIKDHLFTVFFHWKVSKVQQQNQFVCRQLEKKSQLHLSNTYFCFARYFNQHLKRVKHVTTFFFFFFFYLLLLKLINKTVEVTKASLICKISINFD